MTNIFKNNPTERILSFLDEPASPLESLELGSTLPSDLMLQTFIETTVMRYT